MKVCRTKRNTISTATNEKVFPNSDNEDLEKANAMLGCYLSKWTMDCIDLELTKVGKSRYKAMADGALGLRPKSRP